MMVPPSAETELILFLETSVDRRICGDVGNCRNHVPTTLGDTSTMRDGKLGRGRHNEDGSLLHPRDCWFWCSCCLQYSPLERLNPLSHAGCRMQGVTRRRHE
jgi:hypothetical protein